MTPRERALTALRCQEPDRPPIFELLVDPGLLARATPEGTYEGFAREFHFDLILTDTPSNMYRKEWIDRDKGIFQNEWGMKRQDTGEAVSVLLGGPIQEPEDLDSYEPPDPLDPFRFQQLERLLDEFGGERAVGMHVHDSFNYPYYLRGMENMMMDLVLNPELVHRLVRISVEHNIALARRALELGADFILLGDDYGAASGPLVSPQHFREFFLPGLREVCDAVHDAGGILFKHCCGQITDLLDMMVLEAGIDALHPLDKTAHMDMAAVKEKYAGRLCVAGGLDCGDLLCSAPAEDVVAVVEELLRTVAVGGGYILASSNSLHHGTKLDNYRAAVETILRAAE